MGPGGPGGGPLGGGHPPGPSAEVQGKEEGPRSGRV